MPEHDVMTGIWSMRILLLQIVRKLLRFARSGVREMDMVDVGQRVI